jgi:hypothetical protein
VPHTPEAIANETSGLPDFRTSGPWQSRKGFTLVEIMVSLMIFIVVSGAMVGIMLMSSELFRRGEFSRSANDEVVAVLGAVSDDLNHLVPETGDGWFFAGVPSASGNTLVAFTTAGQNPDGIGARGQNARSLVCLWVEEPGDGEPRLRRVVVDDSRDINDFVSSLVITSGVGGRIVEKVESINAIAFDATGGGLGTLASATIASQAQAKDWFGRITLRALAGRPQTADIEFTAVYDWRRATATGTGPVSGNDETVTVVIPSTVLTQGCLHFSAWLALNDIPGMQRPKHPVTNQPDWEQLDNDGGTRLGPWGPAIAGSAQSEVYDTRPAGWIPPTATTTSAPKPPFPSALRLSFVLTGGGRFAPRGILQSDLEATADAGRLHFSGLSLPSTPGSMVRIHDEWIAYQRVTGGRLDFETFSTERGPGRGARRSRIAEHQRGAVIRVGQTYSLVRAIPR